MSRWYIRRIRLNRGGYNATGHYYGRGMPLWYVYSADGQHEFHVRGHRDNAVAAYQWARSRPDPQLACLAIEAHGFPRCKG